MSRYPKWLHERPMSDKVEIRVDYPGNMTIEQVENHLSWAKYRTEAEIYKGLMVLAGVKPAYLKSFEDANAEYIIDSQFSLVTTDTEREEEPNE